MNELSPIKIAVVDCGVSNLWSLTKAVQKFSSEVVITEEAAPLLEADAIILPGIGTFKAGMEGLTVRGLVEPIRDAVRAGKPILGICLGAQLMLSKGYEFGEYEGLGLIEGEVVKFPKLAEGCKIPNIGWSPIQLVHEGANGLFKDIPEEGEMYFVHSYIMKPKEVANTFAMTEYGGEKFCSVIGSGTIYGTQFHPEKSGPLGLRLLENFIQSSKSV